MRQHQQTIKKKKNYWINCDKRVYKWINFGTPQEASLEEQRPAVSTAMLDCMQNYNVNNKNFRALHPKRKWKIDPLKRFNEIQWTFP